MASPELLQERINRHLPSMCSTASVREIKKKVERLLSLEGSGLIRDLINAEAPYSSEVVDNISEVQDGIQNMELVDKATAQGTKLLEAVATVVKLKATNYAQNAELALRANRMIQTAQNAANFTGAIAGLSFVFQLVAVSVRFAAKLADSSHGSRSFPNFLAKSFVTTES